MVHCLLMSLDQLKKKTRFLSSQFDNVRYNRHGPSRKVTSITVTAITITDLHMNSNYLDEPLHMSRKKNTHLSSDQLRLDKRQPAPPR